MQDKKLGVLACAIIAAALPIACGGDGETDDPQAEFVAQADQLCTEQQRALVDTLAETEPLTGGTAEANAEAEAEREQALLDVREEYRPDFEAIEPPAEASAAYEDFLSLREQSREKTAELIAALEEGDSEASSAAGEERGELNDQAGEAAEEAGLKVCAGILPADEVEQIEATIEELETSDDPALCTETMTAEGVENIFGGVEECEAIQKKLEASELATGVDFDSVEGVTGVSARAEGTVQGGALDGSLSGYNLLYEDGTYKVHEIFELSPPEEGG